MTPRHRGRLVVTAGVPAAFASAAWMLFGYGYSSERVTATAPSSGGPVTSVRVTGWVPGYQNALHDHEYALFAWAAFVVLVAVGSTVAAWSGRVSLVWVGAGLLSAFALFGALSIGIAAVPAAVLLLIGAALLRTEAARDGDPPTR